METRAAINKLPPTQRRKEPTPESKVKRAVIKYLRFKQWFVEINTQGPFTQGKLRGRPDLQACKRGLVVMVEVKRPARWENGKRYPEGKLRPEQVEYIKDLVDHKIKVFVTSNAEEFMRELDELGERLWPGENIKRLC